MSRRNIRNITELKGISAECFCGCKMDIYNYGSQYYGQCSKCNTRTETYHSAFTVKNEQHKKLNKYLKYMILDTIRSTTKS